MSQTEPVSRTGAVSGQSGTEMSGMEHLIALMERRLPPPPAVALLGLELVAVEPGSVTFRFNPTERFYNPMGSVHGGITGALCDTAMGCAVQSVLPATMGYTTLEFKINFVRPLRAGMADVRCEGRVLHVGGRVATAEARVINQTGTLHAHATTTCLVFPIKSNHKSAAAPEG